MHFAGNGPKWILFPGRITSARTVQPLRYVGLRFAEAQGSCLLMAPTGIFMRY